MEEINNKITARSAREIDPPRQVSLAERERVRNTIKRNLKGDDNYTHRKREREGNHQTCRQEGIEDKRDKSSLSIVYREEVLRYTPNRGVIIIASFHAAVRTDEKR